MSDLVPRDHHSLPAERLPQAPENIYFLPQETMEETAAPTVAWLRDFFFRVVLKYKRLILATTVVVIVLAAIESTTTTPTYRAGVEIQIDPNVAKVLPYQDVSDPGPGDTREYLDTQVRVLRSRELAARV